MKNLLIIAGVLLPLTSFACNNAVRDVDYYTALYESNTVQQDAQLKGDVSEALTESIMKMISCSPSPLQKVVMPKRNIDISNEPTIVVITSNETY